MAKKAETGNKIVASNKRALFQYFIHERFEAGIVLVGTEVKSLRDAKAQMGEAYARFQNGELWLRNMHIAEYSHGNQQNHDPIRPRKLLLHKRELLKIKKALEQKGMTLVPLTLYFKRGIAKVELGTATGKKLHDKRQDAKKKDAAREIRSIMRNR